MSYKKLAVFAAHGTRHLLAAAGVALLSLPAQALMITASFDASYNAAQKATVNSAILYFQSIISDNVNVKISFGLDGGLGSSSQYLYGKSYSALYTALKADRLSTDDFTAVSNISSGTFDPTTGFSNVALTHAQCAALGLVCGNFEADGRDGTIGINLAIVDADRSDGISAGRYDMMAVVLHEIDEILGAGGPGSGLGSGYLGVEDLFRYTNAGARSYTTVGDDAYFSINGGVTQLQRFNQGPGGDYADWWSIGAHTPSAQDAFGSPGVESNHNLAERTALDVVGWNLFSSNNVPEPAGYLLVLPALLGLGLSRRQRKAA